MAGHVEHQRIHSHTCDYNTLEKKAEETRVNCFARDEEHRWTPSPSTRKCFNRLADSAGNWSESSSTSSATPPTTASPNTSASQSDASSATNTQNNSSTTMKPNDTDTTTATSMMANDSLSMASIINTTTTPTTSTPTLSRQHYYGGGKPTASSDATTTTMKMAIISPALATPFFSGFIILTQQSFPYPCQTARSLPLSFSTAYPICFAPY